MLRWVSNRWGLSFSFLCSHTIPHYHLHRSGPGCRHHQQSLRDHRRRQSHPDGEAVAGPAGREEGLWGRLSGELWVSRFRCGGDQKGWGEWGVKLLKFHWEWCTFMHPHTHTHRKIHPRCLKWLFLSFPAARSRWGHSGELLAGWWAGCCCANQRGQIYLRLQVLAGQRSRRRVDC